MICGLCCVFFLGYLLKNLPHLRLSKEYVVNIGNGAYIFVCLVCTTGFSQRLHHMTECEPYVLFIITGDKGLTPDIVSM